MDIKDLVLEVRNAALGRVGVIDEEELLATITIDHRAAGAWEVTVPQESWVARELSKPGAGIIVSVRGKVVFSGRVSEPEKAATSEAPAGSIIFRGLGDGHHLDDRLGYPQPSNPNVATQNVDSDDRTGAPETLMHQYIRANIGEDAPAARRVPHLVNGHDYGRGESTKASARFITLRELMDSIATPANLGYQIIQRGEQLVFETFELADRSAEVRLSVEGGSLSSGRIKVSSPGLTRAIVGGKGSGKSRLFREYTTPRSEEAEHLWERRIEKFIDQPSTTDADELRDAAMRPLEETGFTVINAEAIPVDDYLRFGEDWNVGDYVTVEFDGQEYVGTVGGAVIRATDMGVHVGAIIGDRSGFTPTARLAKALDTSERRYNRTALENEIPVEAIEDAAIAASNAQDAADAAEQMASDAQAAADAAAQDALNAANLAGEKGRSWWQSEAPVPDVYHRWTGAPNASTSEKVVDGGVVATNLALNPSFEAAGSSVEVYRNLLPYPADAPSGTSGWYVSSGVDAALSNENGFLRATVTDEISGNMILISGDSNNRVTVVPGDEITASIEWRGTIPLGGFARLQLRFLDSVGGTINSHNTDVSLLSTTQWSTAMVSATAPANAAKALIILRNGGIWDDGNILDFRYGTIQKGAAVSPLPFSGNYSPDSDLTPEWTGTANASESRLMGTAVGGAAGNGRLQSSQWSRSGSKSLRVMSTAIIGSGLDSYGAPGGDGGALRLGMTPGKSYTVSATARIIAPLVDGGATRFRKIVAYYRDAGVYTEVHSAQFPNVAGEYPVSVTFAIPPTATEAFIRLYNGAARGGGDVWWDDLIITEGTEVVPYFDGSGASSVDRDIWFDTDDGNKPHRWDGDEWVEAQDQAALDAAAADATTKANAAQAAAIAAAEADATAKADAAEAAATAAAAADAQAKANAAQAAAELAAQNYADLVASDASQDAIDAAAADATAKANAAQAAAEAAAAADATAKANAAEAAATAAAAADAQAKADAAETAAVAAAKTYTDAQVAIASSAASAAMTAADDAMTAAQAAQATADGAIRTYYQADPPAGLNDTSDLGDLWFDTDNDQAYRWSGSTNGGWKLIQDNTIAEALSTAQNAQTTADGKITAYYQASAPASGMETGDLWYDTDDKNKPHYYNGSSWVAVRDGTIADAQATANSKGKVIVQSTAPATADRLPQNLWIDTTGGANTPKRWTGSTWAAVTDKVATDAAAAALAAQNAADDAQADATTALTTANGKNKNTASTTASPSTSGRVDGDLHYVRNGSGDVTRIQRLQSGSWVDLPIDVQVVAGLDAGFINAIILSADTILARLLTADEVTADMISAAFVAALEIEASQIVTGDIESNIGLLGLLRVGGYVEIDGENSSITIYADEEHTIPLVQLRPEGSVFRGQVIADDISVLNGLVLMGFAQLETDGEFVLKAGAPNPEMGPTLDFVTRSQDWPEVPAGYQEKGIQGPQPYWSHWYRLLVPTSGVAGGCKVQRINPATWTVDAEVDLADVPGIGEDDMRGIAAIYSDGDGIVGYYTAVRNSTGWRVARFDASGAADGTSSVMFADAASQSTVGYVSANHALQARVYQDVLTVRVINRATLATVQDINLGTMPSNWSRYLYGVRIDDFDFGSPHLMVVAGQTARFWSLSGSPGSYVATREEDRDFDLGASVGYGGADYDATDGCFKAVVSGQPMRVFSTWKWTPSEQFTVNVAYADSDGTAHTAASPIARQIAPTERRFVRVTLPQLTAGADRSDVYATLDDSPVVLADLGLIDTVTTGRSLVFDPALISPGGAPPTTNTFAAGESAILRSENSLLVLRGDGTIDVPTPTADEHAANKAYVDSRGSGAFGTWLLGSNTNASTGSKFTLGGFVADTNSMSADIGDYVQLNTGGDSDIWTFLKSGTYRIVIKVKWNANSSGHRYIYPRIDNAEVDNISAAPGNGAMLTLVYEFPAIGLDVGQDFRFQTMQNSGSTRSIVGGTSGYDTSVVIQRIGDKA